MPSLLPALLVLVLTACTREEVGEQVLVPDDVVVAWDETFNAVDDGIGVLVPVDVMVYEGGTGEPVAGVALEIRSPGAAILLPDDLELVDPASVEEEDVLWDVRQDLFFTLPGDIGGAVRVSTDEDGLTRVHVWADAFPTADEGFGLIPVVIVTRDADEVFHLVPQ